MTDLQELLTTWPRTNSALASTKFLTRRVMRLRSESKVGERGVRPPLTYFRVILEETNFLACACLDLELLGASRLKSPQRRDEPVA